MRCIFCKKDSAETKSIEHIIPESLGNKSFVLPRGYVCDKCNNYFAHEIERPFLEQMNVQLLRFEESIPNKKDKIPAIKGIIENEVVTVRKKIINNEVTMGVEVSPELMNKLVKTDGESRLLFPAFDEEQLPPHNNVTSRFIAKIAFEALSVRIQNDQTWLDYLIDDPQFDAIRNHVRLGTTKNWPCSIRRIYKSSQCWDYDGSSQIIYESDFLLPEADNMLLDEDGKVLTEIYFIVAIWGIEYAINVGGPEISGYEKWLSEHGNMSPLYYGKNSQFNESKML